MRGIKTLAVPALGIALLAAAWALRPGAPEPARRTTPRPVAAPEPGAAPASAVSLAPPAAVPPAPPREVARALERARVRATWENYRNAVASGNDRLAAALLPILLRDREEASRLAREDLDRARPGPDREAVRRAMEALK